jgi:peptidoglycan/LPS O-acetylase OafA/YrhL
MATAGAGIGRGLRALRERLHRSLSRVTSSGAFIPEIDGLRFVAIMAVVTYHAHPYFFPGKPAPFWQDGGEFISYAVARGYFGVQLFFIISGFVLALPFAEHHLSGGRAVSLKAYFQRRLSRLEPPYIVSLLILMAVKVVADPEPVVRALTLSPHLAAHLFYVHSLVFGDINQPGYVSINLVTWSLEVEIQFYLLAPLLARLFAVRSLGRRRALMVLATAASWLAIWGFGLQAEFLKRTVFYYLHYFLMGFLLAELYLTEWRGAPQKSFAWDLPGIVAWLAWPFVLGLKWRWQPLMPVVLMAAYVGAFRGRLLALFFRNRWVSAVGGMCYTIYLYHAPVQGKLVYLGEKHLFGSVPKGTPTALLLLALLVLVTVTLGAVLFVLFEKPFMRRGWASSLASRLLGRKVPKDALSVGPG